MYKNINCISLFISKEHHDYIKWFNGNESLYILKFVLYTYHRLFAFNSTEENFLQLKLQILHKYSSDIVVA